MQDPQIIQIAPANGAYALFGGREIGDQGEMQQHIADRLPVICWALVASIDACVMGMVAMECGEIALVSQRDDFLGYEIGDHPDLVANSLKNTLKFGSTRDELKSAMNTVRARRQ